MRKFTLILFFLIFHLFIYAQKTDVTIWHSYRGSEQTALEELKNKFNELDNSFNVVLLSVPYDAFANKLTNAIPRGNGPDAFIFAHERIGDWAESSIIRPLETQTVENLRTDTIPSTLEALKY
nr:extracellular solute-binding protein [bacterium]